MYQPRGSSGVTGGGTVATGGFTLTVPATGTAALLNVANVFTASQTITPATPGLALTLNGGTVTASTPAFVLNQTWNNAGVVFTGFLIDITSTASAFGSAPFQIKVGGSEVFNVSRNGAVTCVQIAPMAGGSSLDYNHNGLQVSTSGFIDWAGTLFLLRKASASLQLGKDAAGVTNQTLTAASRITSDGVGADLTFDAGNGRGAAGGSLIFRTAPAAGAGVAGTYATVLTIKPTGVLNVTGIPTSSAGLASGDVYSAAGILTVVP